MWETTLWFDDVKVELVGLHYMLMSKHILAKQPTQCSFSLSVL